MQNALCRTPKAGSARTGSLLGHSFPEQFLEQACRHEVQVGANADAADSLFNGNLPKNPSFQVVTASSSTRQIMNLDTGMPSPTCGEKPLTMTRCSAQAQSKHTARRVRAMLVLDVDLRRLHCESCAALDLRHTVSRARPSWQKTKHIGCSLRVWHTSVLCRGFFVFVCSSQRVQ